MSTLQIKPRNDVDQLKIQTSGGNTAFFVHGSGATLKNSTIENTNTFPAGHVIQVTFGFTSTEVGSTNNTYKDTGLTATMPSLSSNSSKIAIFMAVNGIQKETNNSYLDLKAVYNVAGGSFIDIAQFGARLGMTNDSSKNNVGGCTLNYLLSPNTTSEVIVKAQFRSAANNSGVGVQEAGSTSTLMLMEIAG
tara:strand:- start:64 stop:639 length:576 start_codon:yes stop_codon:yes gene_type:complete